MKWLKLWHSIRSNALMKMNYICKISSIRQNVSSNRRRQEWSCQSKTQRRIERFIKFNNNFLQNWNHVHVSFGFSHLNSFGEKCFVVCSWARIRGIHMCYCVCLWFKFSFKKAQNDWMKLKRIVAITSDEMLSLHNYFSHFDVVFYKQLQIPNTKWWNFTIQPLSTKSILISRTRREMSPNSALAPKLKNIFN